MFKRPSRVIRTTFTAIHQVPHILYQHCHPAKALPPLPIHPLRTFTENTMPWSLPWPFKSAPRKPTYNPKDFYIPEELDDLRCQQMALEWKRLEDTERRHNLEALTRSRSDAHRCAYCILLDYSILNVRSTSRRDSSTPRARLPPSNASHAHTASRTPRPAPSPYARPQPKNSSQLQAQSSLSRPTSTQHQVNPRPGNSPHLHAASPPSRSTSSHRVSSRPNASSHLQPAPPPSRPAASNSLGSTPSSSQPHQHAGDSSSRESSPENSFGRYHTPFEAFPDTEGTSPYPRL